MIVKNVNVIMYTCSKIEFTLGEWINEQEKVDWDAHFVGGGHSNRGIREEADFY